MACVDYEDGEQLRRSRGTGILANLVMITRQLGPALASLISTLRRVVHFAADRSLQHTRIDECRRRMPMGGRSAARPVLDEHCTQTFAGHVRQLVLVDEGHLGVLKLRLIGEDAAERQGGDKQRTEDAFHGALSFCWRMQDQACVCERRSHSSKPMRPRRASPNGTSERSSTRPPKYRASGSLTTSRGSPTAFR